MKVSLLDGTSAQKYDCGKSAEGRFSIQRRARSFTAGSSVLSSHYLVVDCRVAVNALPFVAMLTVGRYFRYG